MDASHALIPMQHQHETKKVVSGFSTIELRENSNEQRCSLTLPLKSNPK
jgi:hypothetical protein